MTVAGDALAPELAEVPGDGDVEGSLDPDADAVGAADGESVGESVGAADGDGFGSLAARCLPFGGALGVAVGSGMLNFSRHV